MTKKVIIGILALGCIASIAFLDVPIVGNVLKIKEDVKTGQDLLTAKNDFIKKVEKLVEQYNGNEDIFKKLDVIFPDNQDVPNMIIQLEALANASGVILQDVTFIKEEKTEGSSSDYGVIKIDMKIDGSYEAFKNFLTAVENNMRLSDVDSISFQTTTDSKGTSIFNFNVVLKTYYQTN